MAITHFLATIVLFLLFLGSVWLRKAIISLFVLLTDLIIAYMAILGNWEFLMFPILFCIGIVSLVMFIFEAMRGDLI